MARLIRGGWPYRHFPNASFKLNRWSPQAKGLVMWVPLVGVEAGADRYVDRMQGRIFTKGGTPVWTPDGWIGNALEFDDGNSEHLIFNAAVLSVVPITLTGWAYSDDLTISQTVLNISDASQPVGSGFVLQLRGDAVGDPVRAICGQNGVWESASTAVAYTVNTWQHVVAVFPANDSRSVYLNGANKVTDAGLIVPTDLDVTSLGAFRFNGVGTSYMSGRIFDARIYNRALSGAEVYEMYRNPWELYRPNIQRFTGWRAPVAAVAIMNQIQFANLGADLFDGALIA